MSTPASPALASLTSSGSDALAARVRQELLVGGGVGSAALAAAVHRSGRPTGGAGALTAFETARRELIGAGPLEPLLADPAVTDVLVNGPEEVWVERDGCLHEVDVSLGREDDVRRLAVRLAAAAGRRLDDASPFVDVRLADGSRLHAVLPPVSPAGTLLSIRVLRHRALGLDDLERSGTLHPSLTELLRCLVAGRLSLVITGGTGTGKTTLLGALLDLVPPDQRIVVAEDAAEVRTHHRHVVRLEARTVNVEGAGAVSLRDLVRQALRMRPDRLMGEEIERDETSSGVTHAAVAADVEARTCAAWATVKASSDGAVNEPTGMVGPGLLLEASDNGLLRRPRDARGWSSTCSFGGFITDVDQGDWISEVLV